MKDKLKLPLIILVLVLVLIGVPVILVMKNKKTGTVTPLGLGQKQEITAEKTVTYNDSSGFKFDYPQNLTVKDVSGDATNIYSSLEISSDKQAGKTTIKIIDSPYNSLESFFSGKEATSAGVSRDVVMASMPAKQVQLTNPKRLETVAISDGVMYTIESPLDDSGYWNKIHNQIVSSLTVQTQNTPAAVSDNSNNDQPASDEEVIE